MRREIPLLIAIVIGWVYVIQFYVPHPPFNKFQDWGNDWIQIIAGFAIILGVLNLLKVSLEKTYLAGPARRDDGGALGSADREMKIRIGVGAGGALSTPDALAELVTGLDQLGFDSLWLSEVLTAP